jgi:hypothetical protein
MRRTRRDLLGEDHGRRGQLPGLSGEEHGRRDGD